MARQSKILPARRQDATNDSLLIRSAESLGRVIGSLQRQLDSARHLTGRVTGNEFSANGHRAERSRDLAAQATAQRKTKSSRPSTAGRARAASDRNTADRKSKRAAKSALNKTATGRKRSGAKQRAAKAGRRT